MVLALLSGKNAGEQLKLQKAGAAPGSRLISAMEQVFPKGCLFNLQERKPNGSSPGRRYYKRCPTSHPVMAETSDFPQTSRFPPFQKGVTVVQVSWLSISFFISQYKKCYIISFLHQLVFLLHFPSIFFPAITGICTLKYCIGHSVTFLCNKICMQIKLIFIKFPIECQV